MSTAGPAVKIRVLPHGRGLPLPERASAGSAGYDLRAAIEESQSVEPGQRVLVPTGLVVEIPAGWEGQVRPRSGLALRHGITLPNAPGTIDSDYRGEIGVILANLGGESHTIERGDRIAQLVFAPVAEVKWVVADDLADSDRGAGGFGSTGGG
ncbi:MAG: dUTP diphosphatase [Acidobacteriota bacterium]|nr:dUTP diphosphatase [Acidobacteriota bacterium]